MLQKRRRTLTIEYLEDRTVPSGLVTAVQDPFNGAVFISGDNLNNAFQINRNTSVLGDVISVSPIPGSHTAVNGITTGNAANFLLASVSGIFISDGNGSNTILLGNLNGFSIPGNISFDVGNGTDNVQLKNIATNAGAITFNGTHGNGTGTDTVNYTNVIAGASSISAGSGKLTVNQTNVTLGFDTISAAVVIPGAPGNNPALVNNSGNSISITNSLFHPAPRLHAIGNLNITLGNGSNNVNIDTVDVGPATITVDNVMTVTGTNFNGNRSNSPSITFSHSNILQADILMGNEGAGARYNSRLTMDTDTFIGQHLTTQVLNESGVGGILASGAAGMKQTSNSVGPDSSRNPPFHINHVSLTNMKFTTAFPVVTDQLAVRLDDGDYYYDAPDGHINGVDASTFVMTNVSLPGIAEVNAGDHYQTVQVGNMGAVVNGAPVATTSGIVTAGQLKLSAGNDLDIVIVSANVTGQFVPVIGLPVPTIIPAAETVQLGDNTLNGVQGTLFSTSGTGDQLPLPFIFTSGQVGTAAIDGSLTFSAGNNLSTSGFITGSNSGENLGWPIKQVETVLGHLQFLSSASGVMSDLATQSTAGTLPTGSLLVAPLPAVGANPYDTGHFVPKLETGQNGRTSPDNSNNGWGLYIDPTIVQSDLRVFMGSGGFQSRESLVMLGVTAGNVYVELQSNGSEIPDGNVNAGVYVSINKTTVTDTIFGDIFDPAFPGGGPIGAPPATPGLTMFDTGTGQDFVTLGLIPNNVAGFNFTGGQGPVAGDSLAVSGQLNVTLSSSGGNTLEAHNTTCAFGIINGGGGDSTYTDDGGNFGFLVTGFIGH